MPRLSAVGIPFLKEGEDVKPICCRCALFARCRPRMFQFAGVVAACAARHYPGVQTPHAGQSPSYASPVI